jgi:serine/threonine-protein phosphatase 2A regulatory subunit B'
MVKGFYNPEEDEPQSEPTWPHLQVVYEFLLRLATSSETDSKLMDKFFSRKFVLNLLSLFDSEDPRERDYLKTIVHRIYGSFMPLRPFIRRTINNIFYGFIYETDSFNGIAEMLEILGSIINGFALPMKQQHKVFLRKILLPLHKASCVSVFHMQLSYCVTQFVEKDASLTPNIIQSLIKYWPNSSSRKEVMFLNEIEEILDRVQASDLGSAEEPLFQRIADSINSPHFQVSERALYILNNDIIVRFISNHKETIVPVLARAMNCNVCKPKDAVNGVPWRENGHWNATIGELTNDVKKLFMDLDFALVKKIDSKFAARQRANAATRTKRDKAWAQLESRFGMGPQEEKKSSGKR